MDELHLFVYPTTRGGGPRWFIEDTAGKWSLKRTETYDNGVLYLVYEPAR